MPRTTLSKAIKTFLDKRLTPQEADEVRDYALKSKLGKQWVDMHFPPEDKPLTNRHLLIMIHSEFSHTKKYGLDPAIAELETKLSEKLPAKEREELEDKQETNEMYASIINDYLLLADALGLLKKEDAPAPPQVDKDWAEDLSHGVRILGNASLIYGRTHAAIKDIVENMADVDFPEVARAAQAFQERGR